MSDTAPRGRGWRGARLGEVLVAAAVLALAAFIGWETANMPVGAGYARVGPRLFPAIVAAGLALFGAILMFQALVGGWADVAGDRRLDWRALALAAAGLVLNLVLMRPGGFVVAAILLFVCVAAAFGDRKFLRNLLIGAVLALVVYLGFTRLLGLNLPAGILPF